MATFKKMKKFSLDETIENSKFDFCKNLKWFLIAPLAICLIGLVLLCTVGFNLGIDFTGGTNMTIFVDKEGAYSEQKYNVNTDLSKIENKINSVLKEYGLEVSTMQKTTMSDSVLPITNGDAVAIKFQNNNELETSEILKINEEIRIRLLIEFGFIKLGADETAENVDLSKFDNAGLVKNNDITTASASAELMMKSFIALLVAVVIILIYVACRFEITSGLAAILALFHDIIVTASVILICRIQINVAFIAALITILGYSINNTIIIFDRMRDDLKMAKQTGAKIDNRLVANNAVRSTMMRSVLTGVTTFIMIFMITVIGVADIREFAFPIMVGILAGFYSSVFITPGLWAVAYRPRKRKNNGVKSKKKDNEKEIVVVEQEV